DLQRFVVEVNHRCFDSARANHFGRVEADLFQIDVALGHAVGGEQGDQACAGCAEASRNANVASGEIGDGFNAAVYRIGDTNRILLEPLIDHDDGTTIGTGGKHLLTADDPELALTGGDETNADWLVAVFEGQVDSGIGEVPFCHRHVDRRKLDVGDEGH